ncbi:monooxygenase [Vitreoscilla massiliensis]|uniref:Monooxygenase n=1 Tax=Vitreoscilla massiliensis TaxID=1689272 RepID=A0ABY4E525_9NEIS|nr:monooxygenase [Vitreoscilla massiliensis]UOO89418.1 monooxygenase [Vitreoscilla massiliensis]
MIVLQIDFPSSGPFGAEMTAAFSALAQDIAQEPGLIWKIWTENAAENSAGGIYLFADEATALAYLHKHTARLESFGLSNIRSKVFQANLELSAIDHFTPPK